MIGEGTLCERNRTSRSPESSYTIQKHTRPVDWDVRNGKCDETGGFLPEFTSDTLSHRSDPVSETKPRGLSKRSDIIIRLTRFLPSETCDLPWLNLFLSFLLYLESMCLRTSFNKSCYLVVYKISILKLFLNSLYKTRIMTRLPTLCIFSLYSRTSVTECGH